MKPKFTLLIIVLISAIILTMLPTAALADGNVCEVTTGSGTTGYADIGSAMSAITTAGPGTYTVKLLQDSNYSGGLSFTGAYDITIDLNGHTCNVTNPDAGGSGLYASGATVSLSGSGALNVTGDYYGATADNGANVTVTNAICVSMTCPEFSSGAWAKNGSEVTVKGKITTTDAYVKAGNMPTAIDGAGVTMTQAGNYWSYSYGSDTVYVRNLAPTLYNPYYPNTLTIAESEVYTYITYYMTRDPEEKNISLAVVGASSANTAVATASIVSGNLAVTGVSAGTTDITATVSDGMDTLEVTKTVTVVDGICEMGGTYYASVTQAVSAVSEGGSGTIKLLRDIVLTNQLYIANRNITFNLNGFTLSANGGFLVQNGVQEITGSGTFNASGSVLGVIGGSTAHITNTWGIAYITAGSVLTIEGTYASSQVQFDSTSNTPLTMDDYVSGTGPYAEYLLYSMDPSSSTSSKMYLKIRPTVTASPSSYDIYSPSDITCTLTARGTSFAHSIKNGSATLVENTDYTVSGNTVVLKKEYLDDFPVLSDIPLTFDFTLGVDPVLSVHIGDTTPITGLPENYTLTTGNTVTWNPQPAGGTWSWDHSFFSAKFGGAPLAVLTLNSSGGGATFTALKNGTSTISYTYDGRTQSISVTVNDVPVVQPSQPPQPSQPTPSALVLKLTSSSANGKIFKGGRVTLTPNISGGKWSYDSSFVTLTQNGDGTVTFKGLKAGTTTVTYTAQGTSVSYAISIADSSLPSTGQDFTPVWVLAALAILTAAAGAAAVYHKRLVSKVK